MNAAEIETTLVTAEDAPIGVQLWPTTRPECAPNFTLLSVDVVTRKTRDASGTHETAQVIWIYENGSTRIFDLGEKVACSFS